MMTLLTARVFGQLAMYFVIPILLLLFSWFLQPKGTMNAASDLFLFITTCDLAYLAQMERGANRINPAFVPVYGPLFGVMLAVSLVLLAGSASSPWCKSVKSQNIKSRILESIGCEGDYVNFGLLPRAARVQGNIHKYSGGKTAYFPWPGVIVCWICALGMIAFHLLVTIGEK
jgi:hypothetical protein